MKINVRLPDEVAERANAARLDLSKLLCTAVERALESQMREMREFELNLNYDLFGAFIALVSGSLIVRGERFDIYWTNDDRILAHQPNYGTLDEIAINDLRDFCDSDDQYDEAMLELDLTPRIRAERLDLKPPLPYFKV
jgi:hypothetical protein